MNNRSNLISIFSPYLLLISARSINASMYLKNTDIQCAIQGLQKGHSSSEETDSVGARRLKVTEVLTKLNTTPRSTSSCYCNSHLSSFPRPPFPSSPDKGNGRIMTFPASCHFLISFIIPACFATNNLT